jgi:hypothetical protein
MRAHIGSDPAFPPYRLLIESCNKAQEVVKKHEMLELQRA